MQPHLIPDLTICGQVAHREAKQAILQEHNIVQPKKYGPSIRLWKSINVIPKILCTRTGGENLTSEDYLKCLAFGARGTVQALNAHAFHQG
jgi:hypothetical protein